VAPLVQRLVAASGITFAVLLVISFVLSGERPDQDAPLQEWAEWADEDGDTIRISALVFGLATYSFLLFLGFLRAAIGEAERRARGFTRGAFVVLSAGAVGITGTALGILMSALATAVADAPAEVIRGVAIASDAGFYLSSAAFGACFVTVGLVNAAVRALPPWLGTVALVLGIVFVLQLGVLLSEDGENVFGFAFPVAWLLLIAFCVGASVTFLKDLNRTAAGAAMPPPSG
jgi:hypothetical protein